MHDICLGWWGMPYLRSSQSGSSVYQLWMALVRCQPIIPLMAFSLSDASAMLQIVSANNR